jgi:predicted CopG family antitoxin
MSKTIRVEDSTYEELAKLLRPRQTFDGAIRELLVIKQGVDQFVAEVRLLRESTQRSPATEPRDREVNDD